MSHETGDPCLKRRSFSQPKLFLQQFCFHDERCNNALKSITKVRYLCLLLDEAFFVDVSIASKNFAGT